MKTIKLPNQRIDAEFASAEADRENRTIPVTWYSGATVLQFSWDKGAHNLKLSTNPDHVRLDALNTGRAPFTRGHQSANNPDAVLGVIEKGSATMSGGKGRATVRFAKNDEEVDRIWNKIDQGILPNVSLEARIHKLKEVTKEGDEMRSFVATDWEPHAIASVAVGADPRAHFAAADQTECEVEFAEAEVRATGPLEQAMDEKTITNAGEQARNNEDVALAAQAAERTRVLEIAKIAKVGKLDVAFSAEHIEKGTSVEEFRRLAFEQLAARSEQNPTRTHHAEITRDEADTRRAGFVQALLHRADPTTHKLTDKDPGYDYRGLASMGLLRMAEECVRASGRNPARMTPSQIAEVALASTSDLPYVLGSTADTSLRAGYAKAPSSWGLISARRTAPTFKTQNELMFDMTAAFEQVPESGEYKTGTLVEGKETWKILTYAQKLNVTRQVIINDELGAITSIPERMGVKAGIKQASLVWGVITTNGALADGNALFHSTHNNLVDAGTAISVDNLGIARKKLMDQTDLGGDQIALTPRYLVVPAGKEQIARQYMSSAFNPTAQSSINPWTGMAEIIVEPRLDVASATAWYLFADPSIAPVVIYAYLSGNEGIFSQAETKVDVDGFVWVARFDFGVGAIDYRGAVKNLGA